MEHTTLSLLLLCSYVMFSQCFPAGPDTGNGLGDLKASVEILRRENVEMMARIERLEQLTSGLPDDNGKDGTFGRNPQYIVDNEPLLAGVRRKRGTRPYTRRVVHSRVPEVGFQAVLETAKGFDVTQPLALDSVLVAKHHNSDTGVFTAPFGGTYMFNLNVLADKGNFVESGIKVNDRVVVKTISDNKLQEGSDEYTFQQGSTSVILELQKGAEVSAVLTYPFHGSVSLMGEGRTSLSGYMLRRHGRGEYARSVFNF